MAATKVKLCGMCRQEDVAAANEARPDYVGFVVDVPPSHRSVTLPLLAGLAGQVATGISRVGVVVDKPVEKVAALVRHGMVDVVQLHGHEDDAYIAALRARVDVPVWQAFRIRDAADARRALRSAANMVLLDSGQGSGTRFDWELAAEVASRRPYVLAGGLSPDNVGEAIGRLHPWGVDMSSGIESNRLKDPEKMRAAVAAVRRSNG